MSEQKQQEFKPCPHCGSDRITVWNIRDGQQAVCKDCKSTGSPEFHGPKGHMETWSRAIASWNKRVPIPPASTDDVVEALRREEKSHEDTIIQRDDAEEAMSQAYLMVTGKVPEWSNGFGYKEALEDIEEALSTPTNSPLETPAER